MKLSHHLWFLAATGLLMAAEPVASLPVPAPVVAAPAAPGTGSGIPTLPGLPAAPAPETVITSQTVDMQSTDTEITTVFDGAVKLIGDNITVNCDHLVVISTRLDEKKTGLTTQEQFKSLVATGHVEIVQGDRKSTSGRAEIFPGEDKLVLTQQPVLIDSTGPYVVTGDRLVLLRGRREITGDVVRVTGPPIKDLGAEANKPKTPASAAPAKTP